MKTHTHAFSHDCTAFPAYTVKMRRINLGAAAFSRVYVVYYAFSMFDLLRSDDENYASLEICFAAVFQITDAGNTF
jgi:hypothetical protein